MKKVLAVVLRAPAAFLALSILGALLDAAGATPRLGAAAAFSPPALAAAATRGLPFVLCLLAWYLAVVAGRRFRSRLAAHATVLLSVAACAAGGLWLAPGLDAPSPAPVRGPPLAGAFVEAGGRVVSIESYAAGAARGVAVVDPASTPRIRYLPVATWDPVRGVLLADGAAIAARPADADRPAPGPWGAAELAAWAAEPRGIWALALAAASFALLATGVRFPVRLFAWPLPGAFLGLLYAWVAPGLYWTFRSPVVGRAFEYAGLELDAATRGAALSALCGLALLLADLTFRPPDAPEAPHG